MSLVSIIVPAYNAEDTLEYTLEDIVNQSYQDFELVIVNDGSTDNTQQICDRFTALDNRVRVITQNNGGPSKARNKGIEEAQGKYITFVDADDRIEKNYLELLVLALARTNADMACGRTDRVKEGFVPLGNSDNYTIEVFNQKESLREMLTSRKITVGPCNRLIPREWYIDCPFLEGKIYEDLSNTYKHHLRANTVAYVDSNIYHYVMRGGSITGSRKVSYAQCLDYYESINLCSKSVLDNYCDLQKDVSVLIIRDYMSLYLLTNRCTDSSNGLNVIRDEILNWCKIHWSEAFTNSYAPLSVRLRVLLFAISPIMYEKAYYIGIRFKGKALS